MVAGWCFYYLGRSVSTGLEAAAVEHEWQTFVGSGWTVACHVVAVSLAVAVVLFGVRRGIERISKILVPVLFVLLIVAAVRALTLPGASAGLERMFRPNFHLLLDYRVWLEAFSQSAWSTGAGWGLLLVYAGYSRKREDPVLNACITGLGNNAASLLAAFAIVPTIFALLPAQEAVGVASAGNEDRHALLVVDPGGVVGSGWLVGPLGEHKPGNLFGSVGAGRPGARGAQPLAGTTDRDRGEDSVSGSAMILMGVVLVIVFGGCVLVSVAAWRQELRRRERNARAEADREPT